MDATASGCDRSEIGFTADERFSKPRHVQGGLSAAMLDDTHGPALFAHVDGPCSR